MKQKAPLIILLVFFGYWFFLTPLGYYQQPQSRTPGYYNVQNFDPGDDAGYYAYLRSGVIDGDFDFFNERIFYHRDRIASTGYTINFWYIGAPILWLPFFMLGHALAFLYSALGYPVALDGYSFPYLAATSLGSSLFVLLGMFLCFECLKKFFPKNASLASTLVLLTATCLPYYAFIRNRMSHSGDFALAFLFLLLCLNLRERPERSNGYFLLLGAVLGLLVDLRYISIVYGLLPICFLAEMKFSKNAAPVPGRLGIKIALAFAGLAVAVLPQLTYWKVIHGVFSSFNPFTVVVGDAASLFASIKNLFFGPVRGLVFGEPIWLFGLAGMLLFFKRDRWLGGAGLGIFAGFCVAPIVVGDSASFGERYMIPAFPFLALGLGQLSQILFDKKLGALVAVVAAILSAWLYNILLSYGFVVNFFGNPHPLLTALKSPPILWKNYGFLWPTTQADYLLHGKFALGNYLDWFFLIILPGLQIVFCLLCMFAAFKIVKTLKNDPQALAIKIIAGGALGFFLALSLFIIAQHPALDDDVKKRRLQSTAAYYLLRDYPNLDRTNRLVNQSLSLAGNNEPDYEILGDSRFITSRYREARLFYQKVLKINPDSAANLQLERIRYFLKEKTYQEPPIDLDLKATTPEALLAYGVYYLDEVKNPFMAMEYFVLGLKMDPTQANAPGMRRIVVQLSNLKQMLEGKNAFQVQPDFFLMLNTSVFSTKI